ncbi:MAG: tyrosine-type recombinase/integrase [Gammaproteobacteria bacterium]|nr:tyrosine-type recombinase/integrase [Gammaproteobacteria bacterium]
MTIPLKTDTQIRALKPQAKQYTRTIQSPKLTKGTLLLLVNPGGKKSFKIRYRYDGKQKGFSLGTYPNTTLLKAVETHNEAMEQLDQGIDPKVYFDHKLADLRTKIDMHQLFEKWHAIKKNETKIAQSTIKNHKWRWDKYLKSELGTLHIDAIKRRHITSVLEEIRDASREEARKSLSTLNMMFEYAVDLGLMTDNPMSGIKSNRLGLSASSPRSRWLNLKEIKLLWNYLDSPEHKTSIQSKVAIKLAILTGARRSEITNMEWSEIDPNGKTWTIPANRAKNNNKHIIYLSDLALALLEQVKLISGDCKYVFISPRKKTMAPEQTQPLSKDALSRAVKRISEEIDLEQFSFHDLRRTAASNWGEELKASSDVVELMFYVQVSLRLVATYQASSKLKQQRSVWLRWDKLLKEKLFNLADLDTTQS